ncbi:MAG: hypothetical protein KF708_09275 [Pirellulales bacterium]|nr:hypothetical protein [Pirellulales bacterium]
MLAIALAWHVRRQSHYDQVLNVAGEEAEKAFLAGDWLTAADRARAAAQAARILGDDSERGRAALQLDREVQIWSRLALTSLDALTETIDRADDDQGRIKTTEVQAEFDRLFGGRTVIIEAWVTRDEANAAGGGAESAGQWGPHVEWSLIGERGRVVLKLQREPAFDRLEPGTPTRILFGAELEKLEAPRAPQEPWKIVVRPGSVALLTFAEPLHRANWPTSDPIDPVLAQQRGWVRGETP